MTNTTRNDDNPFGKPSMRGPYIVLFLWFAVPLALLIGVALSK